MGPSSQNQKRASDPTLVQMQAHCPLPTWSVVSGFGNSISGSFLCQRPWADQPYSTTSRAVGQPLPSETTPPLHCVLNTHLSTKWSLTKLQGPAIQIGTWMPGVTSGRKEKPKLKARELPLCARNPAACHKPDMMYRNNKAP